jgi:hypothetical protein
MARNLAQFSHAEFDHQIFVSHNFILARDCRALQSSVRDPLTGRGVPLWVIAWLSCCSSPSSIAESPMSGRRPQPEALGAFGPPTHPLTA